MMCAFQLMLGVMKRLLAEDLPTLILRQHGRTTRTTVERGGVAVTEEGVTRTAAVDAAEAAFCRR
jgi:hypothetical protein